MEDARDAATPDEALNRERPGDGVALYQFSGQAVPIDNAIRHNAIYSNSGLGIDLIANGSNFPNNGQAAPVLINTHIDAAGNLIATYSVSSTTSQSAYALIVDFYQADGSGQGKTYIATDTWTTTDLANGQKTINLGSALPAVTRTVFIDGRTQPGYANSPLIVLNGAGAGAGANGLTIAGANSTVRGLVIENFGGNGIELDSGGNVIAGNYLGTDAAGNSARGNGASGLYINNTANNTDSVRPSRRCPRVRSVPWQCSVCSRRLVKPRAQAATSSSRHPLREPARRSSPGPASWGSPCRRSPSRSRKLQHRAML